MKSIKTLVAMTIFLAGSFFGALNAAEQTFVAGTDYDVTSAQGSDEPMLEEFFNYACGACYTLEKFMGDFKTNNPGIKVKLVPLELNPAWKIYVKAYYIGEKLNVLDKSHSQLFHRLHVQKKPLRDDDDMKTFFIGLGVDEKAYDDIAKSYWLNTQVRMSKQYAFKNKVMSTPTLLVNKRYKLNSKNLGTYPKIEQAIVELSGVKQQAVAAQ